MEGLGSEFIQLELKYCERCGGLWLRLRGSELVFCDACAKAMAGLQVQRDALMSQTARHSAFWSEGGNA